jgi:asparagine synthase (glutamine-hydrolysing)
LLSLFKQDPDFSFLKKIDGVYAAVIYDSLKKKVYLITDRYGLRHLYWTVHQGCLQWGSELKAMLALPGFEPRVDCQAVKEFFEIGYLLEDRSLIEGAQLLPMGTFLTWDIKERSHQLKRYWGWDEIKPLTGVIDETEIAEELGRLFVNAVQRRCLKSERVGLGLSGGLDSRALLAAMPVYDKAIHAVTFGKAGCDDFRIATRAARVKGAVHHFIEIDAENWLMPRLDGIWWTDGQFNLMHMHGMEGFYLGKELFDICLNGYGGDSIVGGCYIGDEVDSQFSELEKINNRGRRFILLGPKLGEVYLEQRLPAYDNALLEMSMSVPGNLRENEYIYQKMLLKAFPRFYRNIPWQTTGVPIGWPNLAKKTVRFSKKAKHKFLRKMSHFGVKYSDPNSYTDYPNWIRKEPARTFFKETLINSTALFPEYISREKVHHDWERHLSGENFANNLCRYITFEIWLQQVFTGKYRPGEES